MNKRQRKKLNKKRFGSAFNYVKWFTFPKNKESVTLTFIPPPLFVSRQKVACSKDTDRGCPFCDMIKSMGRIK